LVFILLGYYPYTLFGV